MKGKHIINATTGLYISLLFIVLCSTLNVRIYRVLSGGVSLAIYTTVIVLEFYMLKMYKITNLIYIGMASIYVVVCYMLNSIAGLGSSVVFILSLFLVLTLEKVKFQNNDRMFIQRLSAFIIVIIASKSMIYTANFYENAAKDINPNTLGMVLMFSLMLYIVCMGNRVKKIPLIMLCLIAIMGMFNYRARGAIISTLVFFVLCLIPNKISKPKLWRLIALIIIIAGTLFPFVYLNLYSNRTNLRIVGKSLYTGREIIWTKMFTFLKGNVKSWLFGVGSGADFWIEDNLNVHNNYYSVIINFGVIGYLIYFTFIYSRIYSCCDYINSIKVKRSLSMFISSVLVLGFTETTSFWLYIGILCYFGLGMSVYETRNGVIEVPYVNGCLNTIIKD